MALEAKARLGPYEIQAPLGAGGMGEVYRARDPRLARDVAVKVLPEAVAEDPHRLQRFEREARAAGGLNHPNILAVFDVGQHEGRPYVVTELLEGETLRNRLRNDSVPLRKAMSSAIEVARGLAAAHDKGIVHRDLKPENLFVTKDGHVKILDFGLAKVPKGGQTDGESVETLDADALTDPGEVVGTVHYMSPEQVRGRAIDHRSDIFSFGVVLYEVLAGERPFHGPSLADTMAAILREDPPAFVNPGVPEALERIVRRCLEKRPEERFQSAHDIAYALEALSEPSGPRRPIPRRWGQVARRATTIVIAGVAVSLAAWGVGRVLGRLTEPVPALPKRAHLAILGFEATGSEAEAAFAAGFTESLAEGLRVLEVQTHGTLWVLPAEIARTRDPARLGELSRLHGVTLGIGVRFHRGAERVRVDISAIDPTSGRELRSTTIEDHVANVTTLQVEPVLEVAKLLGEEIVPETEPRLAARATNVAAALEAFLRGLGELARAPGSSAGDSGVESLRRAVRLDPLFSPAHLALARACLGRFEETAEESWLDEGLLQAGEASRLVGARAEAYVLMAELHQSAGRQEEVVPSLERAVAAAPDDAEAHLALGRAYQKAGRLGDAEASLQRAIYLRPGFWVGYHWLARFYLSQSAYAAAATQFRHVVESAPQNHKGFNNLGYVYNLLGRREEARRMFDRSLELEPEDNYFAFNNLGTLYFEDSRFADASAVLEQAVRLRDDDDRAWGNLGYAYLYGADPSRSARSFRRAVSLAEKARQITPEDPRLLCRLAGYHAALGEQATGLELLNLVTRANPEDPELMARIAETYEDLSQREAALEWVRRALESDYPRSQFKRSPALRGLLADERYQRLVDTRVK